MAFELYATGRHSFDTLRETGASSWFTQAAREITQGHVGTIVIAESHPLHGEVHLAFFASIGTSPFGEVLGVKFAVRLFEFDSCNQRQNYANNQNAIDNSNCGVFEHDEA